MAVKKDEEAGSKMLGYIWFVVSAALAYPAYLLLMSFGFNPSIAMVAVFIGICLLYEIPYRARVKARHEMAMKKSERWQGRVS